MQPRVTIRDIAQKAGVHFTTVSMALRNSPKLPQQTRERIQAIAEQMGYRPDPMLSALNTYRHSRGSHSHQATLAWLNNFARSDDLSRHQLLASYLKGATEQAERLGFKIDQFYQRDPGMTPDRIQSILHSRNISGLLIAPQPKGISTLDLQLDRFSAVKFGHSLQHPELHTIVSHQYHAMRTMMMELRKLGYERIGVVIDKELDERANNNWQAAFWVDFHSQPEANRVEPLLFSSQERDDPEAFKQWFRRHKPQAVGLVGAMFAQTACTLGLSIPDQLGLAICGTTSHDAPEIRNLYRELKITPQPTDPSRAMISGVYENRIRVGAMAVDLLVSMLARQETGIPSHPQYLLAEGIWWPGCTVRPYSKNKAATRRSAGSKRTTPRAS